MSYVRCLRGIASGVEFPADVPMNLDPVDGRPVEMVLDLERLRRERPHASWYRPARVDMWRFGALLALDVEDPLDRACVATLGEGATPLQDISDDALVRGTGVVLQVKDESRNPSGSFKDRGMAMVASQARRLRLQRLAVPTQGNAGDSLVRYALAAGLEVVVAMPPDTPAPIRELVAQAARVHAGQVHLELAGPTIREAGALLRQHWLPQGWFSVATFQEPGWRIEGKKTLGLELAEPPRGEVSWQVPDAVIYPTGGGTGVLGMWKAWDELQALGLIDARRPRIYCVQSQATRPLVDAFESGAADTTPAVAGHTIAVGLNVPGGVGHARVLEIVRASGGAALAVEDAEIEAQLSRARAAHALDIGTEGAACFAALPRLLEQQWLRRGERVVIVNTGSLAKYRADPGMA